MSSLTADQIVDLFERDLRARKRLAELIVMEPDIRLAIINAVLREVATKDDIKALGDATRKDIKELEGRIQELSNMVSEMRGAYKELSKRIDDLDKRIDFASKVTLLLTGSVLAALIAEIISRILLPK